MGACASAPQTKYGVGSDEILAKGVHNVGDSGPKDVSKASDVHISTVDAASSLTSSNDATEPTEGADTAVTANVAESAAPAAATPVVAAPAVVSLQLPVPAPAYLAKSLAEPAIAAQHRKPMVATPDGATVGAPLCLTAEEAVAAGLPYQVNMLGPPPPPCEEDRIKTVKALQQLDAPPDPELDSILKLVSSIFSAPAALVALFDDKRIFIRNATGAFSHGDFPWRFSFCAWTMASRNPQIMVIPDATKDIRFAENNFVKNAPGVRFYCGTPLMAGNGHRLGTLCFADTKPRKFDAGSCLILNNLAEMVVRHIEKDVALQIKHQDNTALQAAYGQLQRTMDCFESCVVMLDTTVPGWKIMYTNQAWKKMTGMERDDVVGKELSEVISRPSDKGSVLCEDLVQHVAKGQEYIMHKVTIRNAAITAGGAAKNFLLKFRPATQEALDVKGTTAIGVPSYLLPAEPSPDGQRYYFMTVEGYGPSSRTLGGTTKLSGKFALSDQDTESIEGLTMGHLLGKGGFGSVYYGTWYGTPVAVKIIVQDIKAVDNGEGSVSLEAIMGQELRHPHIVGTLQYVVRKVATHNSATNAMSDVGHFSDDSAMSSKQPIAPAVAAPTDNAVAAPAGWGVFDRNVLNAQSGTPTSGALVAPTSAWSDADTFSLNSANPNQPGSMWSVPEQFQTILVMEYCDKGSLQDAVDRGWLRESPSAAVTGALNMEAVLTTAHEIASALQFLHSRNIIHGDLSAWNVMLCTSGSTASAAGRHFVAKIADFGLARSMDIKTKVQTRTYGTLTHMPPETLAEGTVSKATDVYSFGVLLWQMFTSSRPWAGMSHGQIVMLVGANGGTLKFNPGTPAAYEHLALQCMRRSADDRPTFEYVVRALDEMSALLKAGLLV